MGVAIRLLKSLRRRFLVRVRDAAIKLGYRTPTYAYPFAEVMLKHPVGRPSYRWGTLCAAYLAKALGYDRISVVEFGVAGGNGLVKLERIAEEVERISGVKIDVYGFDTGAGLTKPIDYRDLPQLWREGDYRMDVPLLESRLSRAKLILGPVEETVPKFAETLTAPVGFVSFDLDLYSSTMDAFKLFEANSKAFLPRVVCYFDDIIGFSHGDFSGERLAISDFNAANEKRKISQIYGLGHVLNVQKVWTDMMFMFHAFDHERYNDYDESNFVKDIPLEQARYR